MRGDEGKKRVEFEDDERKQARRTERFVNCVASLGVFGVQSISDSDVKILPNICARASRFLFR